eukprot:1193660-Prorocentrum_minimum.AAC.1
MGWVPPSIARKRSEIQIYGEEEESEEVSLRSTANAFSRVRFSLDDQVILVKSRSRTTLCGDSEAAYRADTIGEIICALRDGEDPNFGLLAYKRYTRLSTFAARNGARKFIRALANSRTAKKAEVAAVADSVEWDGSRDSTCVESGSSASCSSAPEEEGLEKWVTVDLELCTKAPCQLRSPQRNSHEQWNESMDTSGLQPIVKQQQFVEVLGAYLACCNPLTFATTVTGVHTSWMPVPSSPIADTGLCTLAI